MQNYCKYNQKSKRCAVWFNRVCADCRSHFQRNSVRKRFQNPIEHSTANLISTEECYKSIKRSIENLTRESSHKDEIWWKMPIVLLIFGCVLVLSIGFCLLAQKVVSIIEERIDQTDIDICEDKGEYEAEKGRCKSRCSIPSDNQISNSKSSHSLKGPTTSRTRYQFPN